ncbi:MAG: hypothetical protein ACI81R_003276 [Bradymonadia bacterium]
MVKASANIIMTNAKRVAELDKRAIAADPLYNPAAKEADAASTAVTSDTAPTSDDALDGATKKPPALEDSVVDAQAVPSEDE